MKSKVAIVRCNDYQPQAVQEGVSRAIDLLGGISAFIKPGSRVLVKPNLLLAKEPESGVCTHPEVVRSVIKVLKKIDCKVFLGDGPAAWGGNADKVDEVYERSGISKIAEEEGVSLAKFEMMRRRGKFPLTAWLDDCEYLVSVPKFKTHGLIVLTGAIKNLYGLVSGVYKIKLHKEYPGRKEFADTLVDIYQEAKPALTVIDGIVAMEGDGPGTAGRLRNSGLLLAGADCVAIDSVLALIMGLEPFDILTTKEAARRALGAGDIEAIEVLGEKLQEVIREPFKLPTSSKMALIPRPILDLIKGFIRFYPEVRHADCVNCGACIETCPEKIISRKNGRIVIDYSGCISCFCCQEACPHSAIKVRKSLVAKLVGL